MASKSLCAAIGLSLALSQTAGAWTTSSDQEEAMKLQGNPAHGRVLYETCAICHTPMGWATPDGRYPQLAGQHPNVIIKQLADIRNRNRDNPTMYPFTLPNILPKPQDIADVASYISGLPMNPHNYVGPANDLVHGERLYKDNCVKCHAEDGGGDNAEYYPRIHGQNYSYLLRQMFWIRDGKRRNADKTMVEQIHKFNNRDIHAVIDYTSRLRPPAEKLAIDRNWRNPDFPADFRMPDAFTPPEPLPFGMMPPEPPPFPGMPEFPMPPFMGGMGGISGMGGIRGGGMGGMGGMNPAQPMGGMNPAQPSEYK